VGNLQECAQTLFTTALPALPTTPANTAFDYGGSQWQISGAVAELVGGGTWDQLWNQYIAEPCGIEVARYGNLVAAPASWDGNPDSLMGVENPGIEGGMISTLNDYARIISLHLNGGACGDKQVLSAEAVAFMREVRTAAVGSGLGAVGYPPDWGYAMGWWIIPPKEGGNAYLYVDPGLYGSVTWIDVEREYGGAVFFEEFTQTDFRVGNMGVINELIPIIEEALDAVR
jgi:CubicO group peptidase (beta-lactamase class C family)